MSLQNASFTRTNGGPEPGKCWPLFEMQTYQDHAASASAGRPIFQSREIVKLMTPGALNCPAMVVTDEIRQQYPKQYADFKAGHEISVDGTPLEEWAVLSRAQVLELKALQFRTVEDVRDMSDHAIQRIGMGGRMLKERAAAFLDDAERVAVAERLAADNEKKDTQIAELTRKVEEMGVLLGQTHAELMALKNRPSEIATSVPAHSDPVEIAKLAQPQGPAAPSSLDSLAAPRRRGRPPKVAA